MLYFVFVILEISFNRVTRKVVKEAVLRKLGVNEWIVRVFGNVLWITDI